MLGAAYMYRNGPCAENAEQRTKCIAAASAACDANEKCYSFIVPMIGQAGAKLGYCLYDAGVGNAAPNEDWGLFFKHDLPCTACEKGPAAPNPDHIARYSGGGGYTYHCVDGDRKLYMYVLRQPL